VEETPEGYLLVKLRLESEARRLPPQEAEALADSLYKHAAECRSSPLRVGPPAPSFPGPIGTDGRKAPEGGESS
jgi:hypothetical protein